MANENDVKTSAAVGPNGTESPVKSPVGVPALSGDGVEMRIARLKARLDSIDMMLGGDISLGQRREPVADWHQTYRRISMLQQGDCS